MKSMRSRKLLARALGCSLCCLLFLPGAAHAYLDPGTGSFIVQILIAALLGGFMAMKNFWSRLASRGRRLLKLGPADRAEDA